MVKPPTVDGYERMKDFAHASFPPDAIEIMVKAMDSAVGSLPYPVGSSPARSLAENILRSSKEGERDPVILARLALLELLIFPRR